MSIIFEDMSVAEAAHLIAARKLSPVELTETYLKRIATADSELNSFVTVTEEHALVQARAAEASLVEGKVAGPMAGIPYGLKDIFETAGIRTTAHSKFLAGYVPVEDCFVQQRLAAAGGVMLGKTATWEFALGGPSWDILLPPARNPWNLARDPSGSSSGSAAAVAAGLCPVAMGSDTGGSIRGPAAACGIVGLKPTSGRLSRRGVLTNSTTYDHCGPMARTVEDAAILLEATAGHDPGDPYCARVPAEPYHAALMERPLDDLRGIAVGIPRDWIENQVRLSHEHGAAFDAAVALLEDAGAEIRAVEMPPISAYEDTQKIIQAAEIFSFYGPALRTTPELFGENFRYRVMPGALLRAEDYVNARKVDLVLKGQMDAMMETVDVMVTPVQEAAGLLEPRHPQNLYTDHGYLSPFALAGVPALVVPMGHTAELLPLGLQFVAARFAETKVLRIGRFYEQATQCFEKLRRLCAQPSTVL